MDAATLFENTMDWLRDAYGEHRFFVERDIVWTAQLRLLQEVEQANLPYRVFNDYTLFGKTRADLALLNGEVVEVAAEFKYEPSHARSGEFGPGKFPVVAWTGEGSVAKDVSARPRLRRAREREDRLRGFHRRRRRVPPSRPASRQRVARLGQRRVGAVDEGGRRRGVAQRRAARKGDTFAHGATASTANRSPSGGDACPYSSFPQHTGLPSGRKAQVWNSPLLMDANRSLEGGDDLPSISEPQHATLPETRNAQL